MGDVFFEIINLIDSPLPRAGSPRHPNGYLVVLLPSVCLTLNLH